MTKERPYTRDKSLPGIFQYSVIRKLSMAISGLVMLAFLYGHWAGNSVLLSGEAAFSEYYNWLQDHPLLHYSVWIIIVGALLAHFTVGIYHWFYNRTTRPVRYKQKKYQATTWAARSMIVSGIVLLLFLVFHIAQVRGLINFTNAGIEQLVSPVHSLLDSSDVSMTEADTAKQFPSGLNLIGRSDMLDVYQFLQSQITSERSDAERLYHNLMAGFNQWPVVLFYLMAQLALAIHLYHGLWSQFQTLGIYHPRYNYLRRPFAVLIGVGIALLNSMLVLFNTSTGQKLLDTLS